MAAVCLLIAGGCAARAQPAVAPPAAAPTWDWPQPNLDALGDRFSPVTSLTPESVGALTPAFQVPLGPAGRPQEGYPLEDGGTLYVTATGDRVLAVDAETGALLWTYDPSPLHPPSWAPEISRGVGLGPRNVYLVTADDRLISLDRGSGRPVYSAPVADPAQAYFESMAPLRVGDRLFVGSSGGDEGARGFVAAYGTADGGRLWRLFTVPARGEGWMAATGFHGGGAVWTTPAYDPVTGTLFAGTGNPSPDYFGRSRPGPDPYTDSVLAVDAGNGALRWAQQEVSHDLWDYDAASPPLVFDLWGQPAVGAAGKDGYWYEWSAGSGAPLIAPVAFVREQHSPPTASGTVEWPGPDGGANYGPSAYDSALHLAFVAGINGAETLYAGPTQHVNNTPDFGTGQSGLPGATWTGTVTAVDVRTGNIAWQMATASPPIGGITAVAGGVVLFGQANGELDALSAADGHAVWRQQLDAPIGTAPIVYERGGVVYVAVVTGGAASLQSLFPSHAPGALVVYRLRA